MSIHLAGPDTIASEEEMVRKLTGVTDPAAIERIEIGWTSRVYVVHGGEFVVKFPRHDAVKEEYAREIALLRQLEAFDLPVQTPRILWTSPEQAYMGYAGIVGTSFDQIAPDSDSAQRVALGGQIGDFLRTLHALKIEDAFAMTLDEEIAEWHYKYGLGASVYARDLTLAERRRLDELVLRELPAQLARLGTDEGFCHGDLGYWNMVVRADGGLGIIDFGDCGYYDRAKDFAALEDVDLRAEALRVYGGDDLLRERVEIRRRLLPVIDLPFYIGKQDEEGLAKTVDKIRAIL